MVERVVRVLRAEEDRAVSRVMTIVAVDHGEFEARRFVGPTMVGLLRFSTLEGALRWARGEGFVRDAGGFVFEPLWR